MAKTRIDYTTIREGGPPSDNPEGLDNRWWLLEGDEAARSITSVIDNLKESQRPRMAAYVSGVRLYGNTAALGITGLGAVFGLATNFTNSANTNGQFKDRITYNVVQSTTDTVTSKIAKNKPRPFFLPSGGTFRVHRKAKKLNKFVDGMFYENKAYQLGPLVFRDAAVVGDGLVKVLEKNGRVAFERVISSEILVDETEALISQPRQMHHIRFVDRRKLAETFPDYADIINDASKVQQAKFSEQGARTSVSDLVFVRESWHLPSGPDADDGKHIITCEEYAISEMEEWNHDFFPFARIRWSPRLAGYWSQGLAEQLQGTQIELNKLMQVVQRATYKAGMHVTWVPKGSNVPKDFITNAVDAVIEYTGNVSPHREVYPVVPPEIYRQIEQHKKDAFEIAGISMLSAASQKPAGLDSKVALREFSDIESDRFRIIGQEYENFFLELARLGLSCARDIAKRKGSYKVTSRQRGMMEEVEWSEIALDENEYGLECFPISSLPRDPAGRLQTIQEYAQAGYLSPEEARRLLDFPDLEAVEMLYNAGEEYLIKILDEMVDFGSYTPPDPLDNLQLARRLTLQYYAVGKAKDLDEDRLDLLRKFIKQIDAIEAKAIQAQQLQAQMSQPTAPPVPPTPSPLVPQAPAAPAA